MNQAEQGGPAAIGKSLGYFPSIDGLRAIAVTTVLLFHLNSALLPGGFVGVDIFFVISGFVVTASLAHLQFPTFRGLLAYFYARRLTRIMPALCVCLLVTIAAYTLFIPRSWLSTLTERTAIYAFLGLSNMVLARNADGYFAATSEFNPFLHTWSLGVEEQFYLIFPFLLFFHGRAKSSASAEKLSLLLIVGGGILSFIVCGVLAHIDVKYAFYLLPSRFWELALGMVLALTFERWSWRLRRLSAPLAGIGYGAAVLLIGFSLVALRESNFPFPMAIIPVVGSGLAIMLVCARPDHGVARLLGSKPMLWIGVRSFSLYLWHWPIYVLMRWTTGLDSLPLQLAALALTFLLGHLSYLFVERPVRGAASLRRLSRWKVAIGGLAATALATMAGAALVNAQSTLSLSRTAQGDGWYTSDDTPLLPGPAGCTLKAARRKVENGTVTTWTRTGCAPPRTAGRLFAIGNSHALSYTPMLRQFALDTGHEVRLYFRTECPYLALNEPMSRLARCRAFLQGAQREFLAQLTPGDVLFMPSMRLDQGVNQWGTKTRAFTDARRSADAYTEASALLGDLRRTGALLVFEAPKPMVPSPVYRCADWYTAGNPICASGLTIDRQEMERVRKPVVDMMERLAATNDRVAIWDPLPALCVVSHCSAFDGQDPIFFDRHHISAHGNRMLRDLFDRNFERWFAAGGQGTRQLGGA